MKLTDIMHSNDWFIYQTNHGNWVLGQASKVDDNGDITCTMFNREIGQSAEYFSTLKEAVNAAQKKGMIRTWKIGYHRWKVEAKPAI